MAKRHSDDAGQKGQLNRRDYLRLGGAAVATAAAGGVGATTSVAAAPDTVVDLGERGLSDGDEIDPYLERYVENGVEVRVPEGEYDWNGEGFTGASGNAAIIGQGEVILNNVGGEYYQVIKATSGPIEVRNFTIRGKAEGNSSRFRLQTYADSKIVVENVNFPDGSVPGAEAKAFFVPPNHAGVVEIRNCYYSSFDDNGIYASPPGQDGEGGGQVIVENCTAHNNNISGIRVGSDNSIVRNCLVINDAAAPESPSGHVNQRGIRVRRAGENIVIEDCEIIHSYGGAGAPIQLHRGAEGGSGTINNVRILNNTGNDAIEDQDGNTADGWTGTNISITGDGDLSYPSNFDATTGSDAQGPTGEDPQSSADLTEPPEITEGTDQLRVMNSGADGVSYEFTATGQITPLYDLEQYNADDDSVGESAAENDDGTWTATGALAGSSASGDSFDFDGYITAFEVEGAANTVTLYLNGRRISKADLLAQSVDDGSTGDEVADDETTAPSEPSDTADEFRIMHAGPTSVSYEFTATDEITPLYDLEQYNANDDSLGESAAENDDGTWTATGALAGVTATGDTFSVRGDITEFSLEGAADAITLYRNDVEIPVEELAVDHTADQPDDSEDETEQDDETLGNVLLVDGTVSDDLAQYRVTVSGQIERDASLSSVADDGSPWDRIQDLTDGATATGIVAKGLDGYRFSGDLVSFQVKGHVDLTIEQIEQ